MDYFFVCKIDRSSLRFERAFLSFDIAALVYTRDENHNRLSENHLNNWQTVSSLPTNFNFC